MSDERTYAAAGVSLATAEGVVERLRAAVESTGARGFGAFAGLHPLDDRRLLAASTDSIGTKPIVARRRGALRACGADMAAHCINDVITSGADPLILLDYVAASQLELEQVAELVEGAAEVCRAAGRRADRRRDGRAARRLPRGRARLRRHLRRHRRARPPHRRLRASRRATTSSGCRRPACTRTGSRSSAACSSSRTTTAPTCSRRRGSTSTTCGGCATDAHAFAHVTGGGIEGNLSRVRPGRAARRARLGRLGAAAGLRLARPPRRRGRGAPRLQPRHRLLRGRWPSRATSS